MQLVSQPNEKFLVGLYYVTHKVIVFHGGAFGVTCEGSFYGIGASVW